jgi:hypothetical protein
MTSSCRWIVKGIPIIIIVACTMHYAYALSGNLTIVALFASVNESVFEHLKLSFWPMLIWWIIGYLIHYVRISSKNWFTAATVALVICPLFITAFYYTYTGAFGIHSLFLDISSLVIGVIIAQYLALHIYIHARIGLIGLIISLIILLLLIFFSIYFTLNPPHFPLFMDSLTGRYGM